MTGHLVGHLVRRGVQHVHHQLTKQEYVDKLEQDAQMYENAGPEKELKPQEFLPVIITGIFALLIIWSVRSSNLSGQCLRPQLTALADRLYSWSGCFVSYND